MLVSEILKEIKSIAGNNAKKEVLHLNEGNELLKKSVEVCSRPLYTF